MFKRFLLILTLLSVPAAGAAQQAAPQLPASPGHGVTLTVSGHLSGTRPGALSVPLPLLERLAAEGSLLAVDTAPVDGRVVVQVRFGFPDMQTFRRWYTDERTVQLLRDLRAITNDVSFESYVSYRTGAGG